MPDEPCLIEGDTLSSHDGLDIVCTGGIQSGSRIGSVNIGGDIEER